MQKSYIEFLATIDEDFEKALKESEREFLIEAIETRQALIQKLQEVLTKDDNLKVKDIAQALQILNAEIRKAQKVVSKLDKRSDEDVDEDIIEMEKRLSTLENEIELLEQ